jgi:hypothetical protein
MSTQQQRSGEKKLWSKIILKNLPIRNLKDFEFGLNESKSKPSATVKSAEINEINTRQKSLDGLLYIYLSDPSGESDDQLSDITSSTQNWKLSEKAWPLYNESIKHVKL